MMKRTDEEEEVFVDKLPGSHVKRRRRIKSDLLLDCNDAKQQKAQQREVGEENDKHLDINLSFKENQVEGKTAGFTMAAAATSSFGRSESMYLGADNNEMKLRKGPLKKRLSPKLTPVSTARAKAMDATTPANKYINGVETAATAATATATKTAPETATKLPPDLLRSHTSGSGFSSLSSLNASFSSTTPLFCRKLMSSDAKKGGYCMVPPQLSLKRTLSKQLMEEPLLKTPISLSTSMKERLPLSAETLPSFSSSYSWSRTPMAFSVSKKSKSYHPVTTTQKFGSHEETGNMPNIAAASASTVDIIRITHPYGTNPHVTIKKRPKTPFLSPLANSGSKAHNVSTRNNNTSRSDDPFSENAIEDKTASDNGATLLKATEAKAPSGITKNVISKGKTSKRKVAALPTATEAKGRLEMASENAVNGIGKQPKLAKAIARSERGVSENVIEGKNMKKNAAKKPRAKKKLINPFLDPLLFDNGSIALTKRPCRCGSTRCLKLYCECFHTSTFCDPSLCNCKDCHNTSAHNQAKEPRGPRVVAMLKLLNKNPNAFSGGGRKANTTGCRCQKSRCLKKFCECVASGKRCTESCRCKDCQNTSQKADDHQVEKDHPEEKKESLLLDTSQKVDDHQVKKDRPEEKNESLLLDDAASLSQFFE